MTRSALRRLVVALAAAPGQLLAQSLPSYAPINPVAQARTGLFSQPYVAPDRKWHFTVQNDYASVIEYADLRPNGILYILDAEVLRTQLAVTRNLGKQAFVLAEGSFNGAYAGFLDGFLDWYHRVTGFRVMARELRPRNAFDYEIHFADGRRYTYGPSSGFIGDVRLGGGFRPSRHWQTTVSVTLPTSSAPAGYRKGVASANATTTLRSDFGKRFTYEGTFGVGYTAKHGELSDLERTTFFMITQGVRARLSRRFHLYGNLIYHSPYYHDTGAKGLDNRELTVDFGTLFGFKRGPEWIVGLTEDLEPKGPAIDISFRLGARW